MKFKFREIPFVRVGIFWVTASGRVDVGVNSSGDWFVGSKEGVYGVGDFNPAILLSLFEISIDEFLCNLRRLLPDGLSEVCVRRLPLKVFLNCAIDMSSDYWLSKLMDWIDSDVGGDFFDGHCLLKDVVLEKWMSQNLRFRIKKFKQNFGE